MIERRVQTVNPLAGVSRAGASSTLRRDVPTLRRTADLPLPISRPTASGEPTGVLQQLRTLETAGLVTRSLSRHGVGRPRHVYDLTPAAQELFPANYGALTSRC